MLYPLFFAAVYLSHITLLRLPYFWDEAGYYIPAAWDFFLVFGTMHQDSAQEVRIENFQGIYLSPQQAKALMNVLGHNLAQYEQTFGELALEPHFVPPGGPVN